MSDDCCSGTISEVCNIEYGTRVVRRIDEGTKYPVYGGGGETFKVDNYNRENRMIISRFAMSETAVRFVNGKFFLNDSGLTVSPKNSSMIIDEFLNYLLLSLNETIYKLGRGTAQKNLNMDEFKNLKICFPRNLESQKQIVSILDKVFAKLDEVKNILEKQLTDVEELYSKIIIDVFSNTDASWESKTLNDVCILIKDGTHHTPTYFDSGYIFLSSKNVTSGKIDWNNVKYIDASQHAEMQKRISPKIGDVLLAKNGTTGIAAIVDKEEVFDVYVSLAVLRPKEIIDSEYLLYFINSPFAKRQFDARLKGIGVPNLHLEEIKKVQINYPTSKDTQHHIVCEIKRYLELRNNLKEIYLAKLKLVEELRKSILEKAFRGELIKPSADTAVLT